MKSLSYHMTDLRRFPFSPLYTHQRLAPDNCQKLHFQTWRLQLLCNITVWKRPLDKKCQPLALTLTSAEPANPKSDLKNLISMAQQGLKSWLKVLFVRKLNCFPSLQQKDNTEVSEAGSKASLVNTGTQIWKYKFYVINLALIQYNVLLLPVRFPPHNLPFSQLSFSLQTSSHPSSHQSDKQHKEES